MAVLAHSETAEIAGRLETGICRRMKTCASPENGLVMMRGRIGGDGAPFNLGEATVSRAAVRLSSGEVGFGYALGRDREKAQDDRAVRRAWCSRANLPARSKRRSGAAAGGDDRPAKRKAAEAAATRVDFYTMVRGEG